MTTTSPSYYTDWSASMVAMKAAAPDVARGFGSMFSAIMKEGALSVRDKELIALGISITMRCEPCIFSHVEKCIKAGATRAQILEAAGVGVVMQGGPAYVYMPKVLEAVEFFEGSGKGTT